MSSDLNFDIKPMYAWEHFMAIYNQLEAQNSVSKDLYDLIVYQSEQIDALHNYILIIAVLIICLIVLCYFAIFGRPGGKSSL